MTSDIFKSIVHTLHVLEIFDSSSGISPNLLLGGHGSHLHLPFLKYVNYPSHLWADVVGVPYGTSLWQAGDSNDKNDVYKMVLARFKIYIISFK